MKLRKIQHVFRLSEDLSSRVLNELLESRRIVFDHKQKLLQWQQEGRRRL